MDTTERLHFHFSLSCIGEGNDNPLQCSCLENPRDSGAWWAAIYGVAQSQTRLKWLSSLAVTQSIGQNLMFSHWVSSQGYVRAFCTMGISSMSQVRFQKSSSFRISFFYNFVVDHCELTPKISKPKGFVWYAILLNLHIF